MSLDTLDGHIDLTTVLLEFGMDAENAAELAQVMPVAAQDDPCWVDLLSKGEEKPLESPQQLMVDAANFTVKEHYCLALISLANAAVNLSKAPVADVPWSLMRDYILSCLTPAGAGHEASDLEPMFWVIRYCRENEMQGRARKVISFLLDSNPDFSMRTWNQMMVLVAQKPVGDFMPLLKAVVHFNEIPATLATRDALVIAKELSKLPKAEVMRLFTSMKHESNWHDHRRKLISLTVRATEPDTAALKRPLVRRTEKEIFISQAGPANVTMVIFCVSGNAPGAPLDSFDHVLAERGIRAIYLCDLQDNAFIKGVKTLGGTRQSMLDRISKVLAERPDDKVITLGASASAIAAIAYGLVLKADGVICLAGFISGGPDFLSEIGDQRNPSFANKAARLAGPEVDVRTWFDRYDNRPKIHMHFAESKKYDELHAEAIADYENVSLHPWEGLVEHNISSEMILRGSFGDVVDKMIADI